MLCFFGIAQKKFILKDSQNGKEFVKKDSLSAVKFLDSLSQNNYYFTKVISVQKKDLNTEIVFDKGRNYNEAWVKIPDSLALELKTQKEFYSKNIDSLKKQINKIYVDQGYAFSRVKSKYIELKDGTPTIALEVNADKKRGIDGFVLKGYEKAPKPFIKTLEKDFVGRNYDEKQLSAINQRLQNHAFVSLERPPQTLFSKDSTTIYLFLQKKKSNSFDGIIGFGNDKSEKFTFNGNLDFQFRNMFNGFESIGINWQRSPDRSQTFDLLADIPYLFKSNIGLNVNVNIYRQDSAYANFKILPALYYNLSSRQKIGIRGHFETSSVADTLNTVARDFSKKGIGIWYNYTEPTDIELFLYKTNIRAEADFTTVKYHNSEKDSGMQYYFLEVEKNFLITANHWLNAKAEFATYNNKQELASNELLRVGGWNSMRGFNENSLFADQYYFASAEYRYLIGRQTFFDVFGQLGQFSNKNLELKPSIYSFGLGFNYFLPIGLMSLQISNGNEFGSKIRFNSTKIHWGILTRF